MLNPATKVHKFEAGKILNGHLYYLFAPSEGYSLLSGYGIQLNPTCCRSIMLSLWDNRGFLYPLIDKYSNPI